MSAISGPTMAGNKLVELAPRTLKPGCTVIIKPEERCLSCQQFFFTTVFSCPLVKRRQNTFQVKSKTSWLPRPSLIKTIPLNKAVLTQTFIGNTFWFQGVPLPAFVAEPIVQMWLYSACQRDFHLGRELLWIPTGLIWTSVLSSSLAKKTPNLHKK